MEQTIETYKPRKGLSIPSITILDSRGKIIENEQRSIFRYNIQAGKGADIIFVSGTNGEWNHISNTQRQELIRISCSELRKQNSALTENYKKPVEIWAGLTAHTVKDTLENLSLAIDCNADAGVIAPLSIKDLKEDEIVPFFQNDVSKLMEQKGEMLPIFLYDNADISVHPDIPHIRTHIVKMLARLPFIFGVKITATKKIIGDYIRAASHFKGPQKFSIYIGNALLAFDLFRPRTGLLGKIKELWNLQLTKRLPDGIVSGFANVFPAQWQKAWQACVAGNLQEMDLYERLFNGFGSICKFQEDGRLVKKTIACIKYALFLDGVISSAEVALETPRLTAEQEKIFTEHYNKLKEDFQTVSNTSVKCQSN